MAKRLGGLPWAVIDHGLQLALCDGFRAVIDEVCGGCTRLLCGSIRCGGRVILLGSLGLGGHFHFGRLLAYARNDHGESPMALTFAQSL